MTPLAVAAACLAVGVLILLAGCASSPPPLTPVARVDLKRYAGKWYEIASYPAWFQRKCADDVTAEYSAQPDGSIRVVNRCRTAEGSVEQSVGRAKIVSGSANAKLKVSFGVPFVTGDYWVIGLDEKNYRWALVGHPSRKYLWILSRQPHIRDSLYAEITRVAAAKGYDPSLLRRTRQAD